MVDLDMRPERRAEIADAVADALRGSMAGSDVHLRGSLAAGQADRFSDIDLLWSVPDDRFAVAVASVKDVLTAVAPVASARSDPEFQHSLKRRLLFIRLVGLPLFWRVDLEIQASSADECEDRGASNPPSVSTEWSRAESAVANGVAAIRAVRRRQLVEATGLLERGFDRVSERFDPDEDWAEAVVRLAQSAAALDPNVAEFANEVADLAEGLLRTRGGPCVTPPDRSP